MFPRVKNYFKDTDQLLVCVNRTCHTTLPSETQCCTYIREVQVPSSKNGQLKLHRKTLKGE